MGQIKDKREDTQQGDIYALYYQQRISGNPVWVGEKVGQTETKSVEELDGNVLFGEESLKTGGKVFHGVARLSQDLRTLVYFKRHPIPLAIVKFFL